MATYTDRGSGTPVTTGTTWAGGTNLANAVDGTPPATPGTLVTWTNAVANAVATIEVSGYDFNTALPATGTAVGNLESLTNITVRVRHSVNNTGRFASGTVSCWDGATQIGTNQSLTLAASIFNNDFTFTPTLAQLKSSTFKIRVSLTGANSTQSRIWSLDHIDVIANYVSIPPKIDTFTEPFNSLTTFTGSAGAPSISAGRVALDFIVPNGESVQSVNEYDLTNSSVFVKLIPGGVPSGAAIRGQRMSIQTVPVNTFILLEVERRAASSTVNCSNPSIFSSVAYNPATMVYFRIRLTGTTLGTDYSADGATWTQLGATTVTQGFADLFKHCTIILGASQDVADAGTDPQIGYFDDLNIAAPATAGRPKAYVAGAFTKKPLKVWSGSAWNEKPVKVWTGSAWKTLT